MQAYLVRYLDGRGDEKSWVIVVDKVGGSDLTSALVDDIRRTVLALLGHPADGISLREIRHLDRAAISLGSRDAALHRLQGGFGGGIYAR